MKPEANVLHVLACVPLFACRTRTRVVLHKSVCSTRLCLSVNIVYWQTVLFYFAGERARVWQKEEAITASLWIIRQESDPYLKVNITSCPSRGPSLHCSPLHYRWWPWQQLLANNIHLNKSFHAVMILTNPISLLKDSKKVKWADFIFSQRPFVPGASDNGC